jgi:hypothetical protein
MKRLLYILLIAMLALYLSGCGSSGNSGDIFIAQILSDQSADGDIAFDGVSYAIANGPDTLFFGIDDADPNLPEYRAFLDFPLDGSSGGDILPLDAEIVYASLEVFVDEVSFAGTIPTLLDLVIYSIAGLTQADFDSPPLRFPDGTDATLEFNFFSSDEGNYVLIDVTSLMRETQRRGLSDFQVRFILDFVTDFGFVGIQDRPNITVTAPELTVEFR